MSTQNNDKNHEISIDHNTENSESHSENNDSHVEIEKLNELATDLSDGSTSTSVLREVARLQVDNTRLSKQVTKAWSVSVILGFGIIGIFVLMMTRFPLTKYLPSGDNSGICSYSPQSDLSISDEDVMDFAKSAILNSYSYDYVNYREKINNSANQYFTSDGRKDYFHQLDASGNLDRIIKGNLIQRSNASLSPQMEERDSDYQWWVVQVPMNIEFYSGGESKPRTTLNYLATVRVLRIPPTKGKKLPLGIDSIYLKN